MTETAMIEVTITVPYRIGRVWDALTTPELLEKWWAPNDIEPVVGRSFDLDMGGFGAQRCTVLSVEPQKLLSYTFGEGMLDTAISWRLVPAGEGTELSLIHSGFDLTTEMGSRAYQGMSAGWPQVLERLEGALGE